MKKKNLYESCGPDWINRRVAGAYFVMDGRLAMLRHAEANGQYLVELRAGERKLMNLPADAVKGFGLLEYPKLGYRRDPKTGTVGFFFKHHTFERGLRPGHIKIDTTPGYRAIGREWPDMPGDMMMQLAFLPQYDKAEDVEALLASERFSVVLNADVMVEPSVADDGDDLTVYYRKRPAGHINVNGKVAWRTPEYGELLSPLFKNTLKV